MSAVSWFHSLTHIGYLAFLPYLHVTFPEHSVLIVIMGVLFNLMDFMVSDAGYKNLQTISKHGTSYTTMMIYMSINFLIIQAQWIHVGHYVLDSVDHIDYYFDLPLLFKIIITMGLGDIYFFWVHKTLHVTKFGASLHKIHHCCFYPSLSTNLMFNPVDTMIEFTGPNSVLLISYFILNDAAFLVVCGCIILCWYAYNHDENFKSIHYYHHIHCDGQYPVYTKWKVTKQKDCVKQIIRG